SQRADGRLRGVGRGSNSERFLRSAVRRLQPALGEPNRPPHLPREVRGRLSDPNAHADRHPPSDSGLFRRAGRQSVRHPPRPDRRDIWTAGVSTVSWAATLAIPGWLPAVPSPAGRPGRRRCRPGPPGFGRPVQAEASSASSTRARGAWVTVAVANRSAGPISSTLAERWNGTAWTLQSTPTRAAPAT